MDTESVRDVGSRGASVAERAQVRPITNEEGNRLLRILRRGTGPVVTWHRAQMVLLSAQAMDVPQIARVTFTSADRVRDVLHNFNADGFESLYPRYKGGRLPKFTEQQRDEIKRIALSEDPRITTSRGSFLRSCCSSVATARSGLPSSCATPARAAVDHSNATTAEVVMASQADADPAGTDPARRCLVAFA
jgi:hypothetical protein